MLDTEAKPHNGGIIPSLKTTPANLDVGRPYEVLRGTYGVVGAHDNRPTYVRLLAECLSGGKVVHEVAHVVQCKTNMRTGPAVLKDAAFFLRLLERLDFAPSRRVELVVCDLNAFLLATRQRIVCSTRESVRLRELRRGMESLTVPVVVRLGPPAFSRELAEYIERLVAENRHIVPTFERLGYVDRRWILEIEAERGRVGLWK